MALLFRVAVVNPLNCRDQGRCSSARKIMGSQTLVSQQFRCTTSSRFVDRVASSCNWMRATGQINRERSTSMRRTGCRKGVQRFGLGGSMCGEVRISNKWKQVEGKHKRDACIARASMRLDPGGGPGGEENGIGRVVVNLALAGGLTYLTITGKLGWLFDAFVSLWLFVVLVPIVGFVAFLWFADREIVSSSCPNCGNPFQVLEFTMKEEPQFCPYCSQPFKLEGREFVRDGPRFSKKQSKGFRQPFGGSGRRTPSASSSPSDPPGVIVDVEAEVMDQD